MSLRGWTCASTWACKAICSALVASRRRPSLTGGRWPPLPALPWEEVLEEEYDGPAEELDEIAASGIIILSSLTLGDPKYAGIDQTYFF